jgi:hypothetical protein
LLSRRRFAAGRAERPLKCATASSRRLQLFYASTRPAFKLHLTNNFISGRHLCNPPKSCHPDFALRPVAHSSKSLFPHATLQQLPSCQYGSSRWWRPQDLASTDSLHLQALTAEGDCVNMAVRAASGAHRREDQGERNRSHEAKQHQLILLNRASTSS